MLIAITGPDGTGKTTAAKALVVRLNESGARAHFCSVWDARTHSEFFKDQAAVQTYLATVTPHARLLFLAHAMSVSLELAKASGAEIIVTDSYIYKYLASEIAYGITIPQAEAIGRTFEPPDQVFFLSAPADVAAERKGGALSPYETGLQSGGASEERFKKLQQKTRAAWIIVRTMFGPWTDIDSAQTPERVVAELLTQLRRREWLERFPAVTI
ncbi:MAG TPA: AAA family ATPase [Bdellovibrionales bacterium]|nr:AAA family ATPase [Bdellovibrionales bacterium]